jgi:hypothetical protein
MRPASEDTCYSNSFESHLLLKGPLPLDMNTVCFGELRRHLKIGVFNIKR